MKNNFNILLCSPMKGYIGGISRWTEHILDYYNKVSNTDINIKCYFPDPTSYRKIKNRFIKGIVIYFKLIVGICNQMRNGDVDIIHLCSSSSISLIKDIVILFLSKIYGVKFILHFHFGRIPEIYERKNYEYYLIEILRRYSDSIIVLDRRSYNCLVELGGTN